MVVLLAVTLVSLVRGACALPVARLRGVKPVVEIQSQHLGSQRLGSQRSEIQRSRSQQPGWKQPGWKQPGWKQPGWKLARERDALVFNDIVRTGPRGGADLMFNNGTCIALRSNSQLQILERADPSRPLVVRVLGALSEIFVRAKGPTEIRTMAGTAAVRGTQYLVQVDAQNRTRVTVTEGTVAFFNPQGEVLVGTGQQSSAEVGRAPSPPVAVDPSGLLQWTFDLTALPLPFELGGVPGAVAGGPPITAPDEASRAEMLRAVTALQTGDWPGATTLLRGVTNRQPALFQAQSLLSLALLQQNDLLGARRAAQSAVGHGPRSALAHAALSLAFFFTGESRPARREAMHSLSLDPLSPLALLSYSRAQTALGQTDEARQALEQAAVLAPDFPLIQRELGALYLSLDRLPQAEAAFRRVLAKTPRDGMALAGLGTVQSRSGQGQQAQESFDAALVAAPRSALVRAQRAAFLLDNGQLERVREETEAFLHDIEKEQGAHHGIPSSATSLSAGPKALGTYAPELGAVFIRLSEAALYRQNLAEAFDYGRRAVQLLPASAPAHYQWGRVFLEQERTTQALAQFRLALALDPRHARARYALGFTQELAASDRDITRVLGAADAAAEGGPSQGLSLRNLQSPGAAERIQAALQDPTVVRTATRSYGDTQLGGALGRELSGQKEAGPGQSKEDSRQGLQRGEISVLRETGDRRGVWGFTASTHQSQGVRRGADQGNERASLSFGQKSRATPSGFFGLAQWEKRNFGTNTGVSDDPLAARQNVTKPQLILGFNWQPTQKASTRIFLGAENPSIATRRPDASSSNALSSLHGEARHERQWRPGHWLNIGASWGFRGASSDRVSRFPARTITGQSQTGIRSQGVYLREEYRPGTRLALTAEIKVLRLAVDSTTVNTFDPPLPLPRPGGTLRVTTRQRRRGLGGVPTFLAAYQLNPSTSARLRWRGLLGGVEDFDLLSPRDNFLFSAFEVPALNFLERGRSCEVELTHTFPSAAFLQVGLFQQSGRGSVSDLSQFTSLRFRGVRLRYEGILSRRSTFFLGGDYNAARGVVESLDVVPPRSQSLPDVPSVRFEAGVQYLGARGFFVQPTVGYFGGVAQVDDFTSPRQQRGGFTLANLRVGWRRGLRRVLYVEARNLLDKSFTAPGTVDINGSRGAGRQVAFGFVQRY